MKALEYYGNSLREARKLHDNHLDSVICVAFLFILESILGNREAARIHLKRGKELLHSFESEAGLILPRGTKFEAVVMQLRNTCGSRLNAFCRRVIGWS